MLVYLDNAATAKMNQTILDAMLPYLTGEFGNPSTIYSIGQNAKKAVENSRNIVAEAIGATSEEIYFTSGGTESINWAIKSTAEMLEEKGKHIITSKIEHPAVMESLKYLAGKRGYDITYLSVNELGQISLDELRESIRTDTILITIMTANNEIGTIMPVEEIGIIAKENNVLFHTDAVQAVGHIPVDVAKFGSSLLSLSGHKMGGIKGAGVLYIKKGLQLPPFIHGGGQEHKKRSGTENVAGIVSVGAVLDGVHARLPLKEVIRLRDKLIKGVMQIPATRLTGDPVNRLPGVASFLFEGIEGESILLMLNQHGICASSGSACTSGSLDPSHVLLALGLSHEAAHGSLRLSLSESTTDEEVDFVLEKLPEIIAKLRAMSPVWNKE
jgi:cysteine desulfurase